MLITANIFVETKYDGANVGYVTTEQGIVMIDAPQRPTDAIAWRREIEAKGKVKYLINTEPHPDHFTGDYFFSAPVIAHQKARDEMLLVNIRQLVENTAKMDSEGSHLLDGYKINIPSITYSEYLTLFVGKFSFHLISLPGHTTGMSGVYIPEEKVIFTGDNVLYRMVPRLHSAEPFALLQSLDRINALDIDYVVPGHGEVCKKSYIAEHASAIRDLLAIVQKSIDQGWTKTEALSRINYPILADHEVPGPELQKMNISRLYDVLSFREKRTS